MNGHAENEWSSSNAMSRASSAAALVLKVGQQLAARQECGARCAMWLHQVCEIEPEHDRINRRDSRARALTTEADTRRREATERFGPFARER